MPDAIFFLFSFFFKSKTQILLSHGQFRASSFQIRLWKRLREMYIRLNGSVSINRLVHAQCFGIAISVNAMDTQRLNENMPSLFCMNILNTLLHKQRPHYAASVAGSSTGGITGNGKATKKSRLQSRAHAGGGWLNKVQILNTDLLPFSLPISFSLNVSFVQQGRKKRKRERERLKDSEESEFTGSYY